MKTTLVAAATAIIGCSLSATAHSRDTFLLRALKPRVDPAVTRYIARNALPVPSGVLSSVNKTTPRQTITALCGSMDPAYYKEFLAQNKLPPNLNPDALLPHSAQEYKWPACLYVKTSVATQSTYTAPVPVISDLGREEFERGLKKASSACRAAPEGRRLSCPAGSAQRQVDTSETPLGEIITAWEPPGSEATPIGGSTASTKLACQPFQGSPVDADSIKRAYRYSYGRNRVEPRRVQVFVVDNGFFGADHRRAKGKEFEGSAFSSEYFALTDDDVVIQRMMAIGGGIYPINYQNRLTPDTVSGHGTHVAGLILGGPAFETARRELRPGSEPWVRLTILNFGKGTRWLEKGAETSLQGLLVADPTLIVNMSVAYKDNRKNVVRDTFRNLFRQSPQRLFVVSSGNAIDGNVTRDKIYPAALGGVNSPNVITVAALDGTGVIPPFSNTDGAAVDMAAPGCLIESWIDNTKQPKALSGTSQAAPLVTFAASLVRSLVPEADAAEVKNRLVAAGDLLSPADEGATAYGVRLNITRSLFWFDDYVRISSGKYAGEYLGRILELEGLRCDRPRAAASSKDDIWAYKRGPGGSYLFLGKEAREAQAPCRAVLDEKITVLFRPSHKITPRNFETVPLKEGEHWLVALAELEHVVFKMTP